MDNIVFVFVLLFSILFVADSIRTKDLDLDSQLKLINKPALKSFQTKYGDIIDCVDINKQHTFDHPLLKNHKIQFKPETTSKQNSNIKSSSLKKSLNYMPKSIKCPPESVPIRRASREDLIMSESMKSLGLNRVMHAPQDAKAADTRGYEYAALTYNNRAYGARARMNLWTPVTKDQQISLGGMSMIAGPREDTHSIQTGWLVNTYLSPNTTTLYTFWTADSYQSTGCYNLICPGFVQVSEEIVLGLVLPTSTFSGSQTDLPLSLYQDRESGNWWLVFDDMHVGYWPKVLIPRMADGATFVSWGGQVYSPIGVPSPEMGSGHFPEEGYSKAAYMSQIKVIASGLSNGTQFDNPADGDLSLWVNAPTCYNAKHDTNLAGGWGRFLYYGGPGNCTF